MAVPVMPGTHIWCMGGPGLKRVGNTSQGGGPAIFASSKDEVWVWDEDTDIRVTDLLDENANPITSPVIENGWVVGVGVPVTTGVPSMSIGEFGQRYQLLDVQSYRNARAALAPTDTQMATVAGDAGSDFRDVLNSTIAAAVSDEATRADATYSSALGGNLPRTLAKLRNGEDITIGVIGDSKEDPGTPGNVGGSATARLATLLQTRFGVTVTVVNVAESGDTAAVQFLGGGVATLVAAAPDLTVVNLGTNDTNSDASGQYAAGYVKEASWAAIERACAYLRDAKESAEFFLLGTTPYTPASSSNAKIVTYNRGIQALAAVVGAEFHSLYDTWWNNATFQSSPTTYLYDSTHPNAAGNDLSAAAMLTHFPLTSKGMKPALAPRATNGKYGVSTVNKTLGALGYFILATAGTANGNTLTLTGSWSVSGNYDVTTTVGDSFTLSGTSVKELLAQIDLGDPAGVGTAYPVVDFYLDDVLVTADVNLHTQSGKDSTAYWLAPFVGLDGGAHAMKVVLKSGMLRVGSYAVLVGASGSFTPATVRVDLGAAAAAQDLSDGTTKYLYNQTLNLPVGWVSAEVLWHGKVPFRAVGTTTTTRSASTILRVNSVVLSTDYANIPPVPTASESWYAPPVPVLAVSTITGNVNVKLEARAISTDKTSFFAATGGRLVAVLQRTA